MVKQSDRSSIGEVERDVCRLVHRFVQRLDVHVRAVADEFELTATQVVALRELSEPITARELASRMSCEPSNVTFVLDKLEERRLIQRRPHPTDRRAKQIVLTATGKRLRTKLLGRLDAQSPLAPLTAAQQESFRSLLGVLVEDG